MTNAAKAGPSNWEEWQPRSAADDDMLWRYMTLERLVWLLTERTLWLARADQFAYDPTEGSVPRQAVADAWDHLRSDIDLRLKWEPPGRSRAEAEADIAESLRMAGQETRVRMYLSCWSLDVAESQPLWHAYAPEGVAIQTSAAKLRKLFPETFKFGLVEYINFTTETLPHEVLEFFAARYWYKPIQFAAEKEARAGWYDTSEEFQRRVGIPLPLPSPEQFVEKLIVAPFAGKYLYDTVRKAVSSYLPETKVVLSDLDEARHY
jgi:hypothetical protein